MGPVGNRMLAVGSELTGPKGGDPESIGMTTGQGDEHVHRRLVFPPFRGQRSSAIQDVAGMIVEHHDLGCLSIKVLPFLRGDGPQKKSP